VKYLLVAALLYSQVLIAQPNPDAGEYLGRIGEQFNEISKDLMSYASATAHGKGTRKVEKKRQELIGTLKQAEFNVRKLRPFKENSQLRDTVASYLRLSRIVLTEDFGKIINLEDVAEQSYDAMEAYLLAKELAYEKLDQSFDRVKEQQQTFAKMYEIKLIESESEVSRKLEKAGKVNAYYNQVYLVFFKSYKDEVYLMEALGKGDVNAMEQTKNALASSSVEGLKKLIQIGVYNYDATLKNACSQMLTFLQQEANDKMPGQIDFYLKKENFEKLKKALDSKRQSDRTQTDIDQYNKSLKDFNDAVTRYNSVNNELNKKRSVAFEQWNKAVDDFMAKHVPRYR
jgi:hypothetical protein